MLKPPSRKDVAPRKRRTALSKPPEPFAKLVVLDFEWTADDGRAMRPCAEIIQFPSVLVELDGRHSHVVDEFDAFVRPTLNPRLTPFSTRLTGIEQSWVDRADPLAPVLARWLAWLRRHRLVDERGERLGRWSLVTWSGA